MLEFKSARAFLSTVKTALILKMSLELKKLMPKFDRGVAKIMTYIVFSKDFLREPEQAEMHIWFVG